MRCCSTSNEKYPFPALLSRPSGLSSSRLATSLPSACALRLVGEYIVERDHDRSGSAFPRGGFKLDDLLLAGRDGGPDSLLLGWGEQRPVLENAAETGCSEGAERRVGSRRVVGQLGPDRRGGGGGSGGGEEGHRVQIAPRQVGFDAAC